MMTQPWDVGAQGQARRGQRGFTLVELMVAIALMLVVMLQLNIIFNNSRLMFARAEGLVTLFQNARGAVDLLERDIANAIKTDQMEFFNDNIMRSVGVGHFNEDEVIPEMRGRFIEGEDYIHNLAVRQPAPYEPPRRDYGGPYRQDAVYFRTFTTVEGVSKEALVEYSLWTGTEGDGPRNLPILQRRVIDVERIGSDGAPVLREHPPADVCYNVQEFRVEAFLRERSTRGIGRFYSAREAVRGGTPPAGDPRPPNLPRLGTGSTYAFQCVEKGRGALDASTGVLSAGAAYMRHLKPGDQIYMLTDVPPGSNFQSDFDGYLTISTIDRSDANVVRVRFEEQAYIQHQLGVVSDPEIGVTWRSAFMPAALRITLKIRDPRTNEVREIQRIFQIRS